ncbi:hypothetical protein DUNSADRAFT_17055, partial [Dunaliella salina]
MDGCSSGYQAPSLQVIGASAVPQAFPSGLPTSHPLSSPMGSALSHPMPSVGLPDSDAALLAMRASAPSLELPHDPNTSRFGPVVPGSIIGGSMCSARSDESVGSWCPPFSSHSHAQGGELSPTHSYVSASATGGLPGVSRVDSLSGSPTPLV